MSHNPGGPLPRADREPRTTGRPSSSTRGARAHLPALQSPWPSAQLLSERGDIDDRPRFHDPSGREAKEGHSLDTDARAVARHTGGDHGVPADRLPVHRDQILAGDRTLYRHLEIRHGRSPGLGRCAVLLEGVVSRGPVRYEIGTVDLVEPGETSFSHAFKEHTPCGAHVVRSVGTGAGADRDSERHLQRSDRNQTHGTDLLVRAIDCNFKSTTCSARQRRFRYARVTIAPQPVWLRRKRPAENP